MSQQFSSDAFISYRSAEPDKTWVRTRLVPRLKDDALRVCVDYENFRLGQPLVALMQDAVVNSRYTVVVLTPAYLKGPFATFEQAIATHLELEQQRRRLIFVMREPTEVPLSIRYKLWLDMTDDSTFDDMAAQLSAELSLPLDA